MNHSSPQEAHETGGFWKNVFSPRSSLVVFFAAFVAVILALLLSLFTEFLTFQGFLRPFIFTMAIFIIGLIVLGVLSFAYGDLFLHKGSVTQDLLKATRDLEGLMRLAPLVTSPDRQELLNSETLLLQPREYTEFVRKLLDKQASPERIGLMGSLVGFTVTVAHDLGILAYRQRNNGFERFTIVGSKIAGDPWSVHNFQLKLMKSFVACWDAKGIFDQKAGWSVRCESFYVDHDVLAAALLVENDSLIVLQSLNPTMLAEIFSKNKYLMGFRHPPGQGNQFVFSRYRDAIDTYQKSGCENDVVAISYNGQQISISSSGNLFPVPGVTPLSVSACSPPMHSYRFGRNEFTAKKREILQGLDEAIMAIETAHPTAMNVNRLAADYLNGEGKAA